MKKKFIAMFCAVLMTCSLMALTACGGGGGGDSKDWWSTTGELVMNGDEVVFNDVQVKFTTVVTGEDKGVLEQLVSEFNDEYRGKINIIPEYLGQDGFETLVSSRITQNYNAPDLIMSHQKGHKSFADLKLIQPFDEAMEKSGITIDKTNYADILAKYMSLGYEDKMFGVPIDAQSEVVLYNKKILAKYSAALPTNRSELLELCGEVKTGENIMPIAVSSEENFYTDYYFTTAIMQNGGHLYDENNRADWHSNTDNRASFVKGINSIREMNSQGYSRYGGSESGALGDFLGDKTLFYVTQPWYLKKIISSYASRNNLTVDTVISDYIGGTSIAKWFADDNSSTAGKIFGDSHFFAMSTTVKDINKKAAMLVFIKWFTETGSVGARWGEAGHISVSKKINESQDYLQNVYVNNYIKNFYPYINNFECMGITPYYSSVSERIAALCAATVGGTVNIETQIKTLQDDLNGVIDFAQM